MFDTGFSALDFKEAMEKELYGTVYKTRSFAHTVFKETAERNRV